MKKFFKGLITDWPRTLIKMGMLVILMTIFTGLYYKAQHRKLIGSYHTVVRDKLDLSNADLDAAYEYNEAMTDVHVGSTQEETLNKLKTYNDIFNENNGLIGVLTINKINLMLPIYHGTEESSLSQGIGHYEHSSFPLDNYGSKSILTGHTGNLGVDALFTRLDEMKIDDKFYITVGQWNYHFKVKEIKPWLTPEEADEYAQKPNNVDDKSIVTLITCTPYGINSHRLLVIGEFTKRTLYDKDEEADDQKQLFSVSREMLLMMLSLMIGGTFLIYTNIAAKKRSLNEKD